MPVLHEDEYVASQEVGMHTPPARIQATPHMPIHVQVEDGKVCRHTSLHNALDVIEHQGGTEWL